MHSGGYLSWGVHIRQVFSTSFMLLQCRSFVFSSHLLSAQQQLQEELSQTQQVIRSYHSLGEEFTLLTQQYRQLREEIENKQWALTELGKPQGSRR